MKSKLRIVAAVALALTACGAAETYAQIKVSTNMLVPGIRGGSTDPAHPNWIEVLSLSQGASATKKNIACTDFSMTKPLDQAGPALWVAAALGRIFPEIRVEVTTGTDPATVIYDIRLNNARVTSVQTSSSGAFPVETVSFVFDSVTLAYNGGPPETIYCQ